MGYNHRVNTVCTKAIYAYGHGSMSNNDLIFSPVSRKNKLALH